MGYQIQGVIGRSDRVVLVAQELDLVIVDLSQGFSLLPWTPSNFDLLGPSDRETEPAGFLYSHSRLLQTVAERSGQEGLAYVEADFFGGTGDQGAIVFRDGKRSWLSERGQIRRGMPITPISEALQRLGVDRAGFHDEFAALGLGRHRETEAWLSEFP